MMPVSPVIPGEKLDEVKVAANQPEYQTLPVIFLNNGNTILSRWAMDEAERKIVDVTGELFICLLTFGGPAPECTFQVDHPTAPDAPGKFLKPRTAYKNTDLPILAKTDSETWYSLQLTDDDRRTVADVGDVYFFMNTNGNLITPQMIQVERPELASIEVEFIVGIRADAEGRELAAQFNIETHESSCAICSHGCLVSAETVETINSRGLKIICSVCSRDGNPRYCFFPETVRQLKHIIENGRSGQN